MTRTAVSVLVTACLSGACAQPLLLKSRRNGALIEKQARVEIAARTRDPRRVHRIVQFAVEPGAREIERIARTGARVLEYVPYKAVLVASAPDWDPRSAGAARWETVTAADKWSAELDAGPAKAPAGGLIAGVLTSHKAHYLVEFFPGVTTADARAIVTAEAMLIRDRPELRPNHLLVEGTGAQARALTGWEEVAYVFPASTALEQGRAVSACAGAWTVGGGIGQYVDRVGEGWDGPGKSTVELGFQIRNVSAKLPAEQGRAEIERAFAEWSRYVKVTFAARKAAGTGRQIDIEFASGEHGDPYPFDGAGRVLAHTFYPAPPNPEPLAGDLHLDDAEIWRVGNDIDLYSVVLHELGHALGLGHSDKPGSVMYAYYQKFDRLAEEDISAVRAIYAAREETGAPSDPGGEPAPNPEPQPEPEPQPDPEPEPEPGNPEPGTPEVPDKVAPILRIASPASSSSTANGPVVTVRGTASDNIGVTRIVWTLRGTEGEIPAAATWSAEIPVIVGINTIVIRAWDAAGNSSWRSISVTRRN